MYACTAQVERGLAAVTYLRKQVGLQHLPTVQQQQQDAPSSGGGSKAGQKFMQGLLAKAQTQVHAAHLSLNYTAVTVLIPHIDIITVLFEQLLLLPVMLLLIYF
jgi:hypothetical protein